MKNQLFTRPPESNQPIMGDFVYQKTENGWQSVHRNGKIVNIGNAGDLDQNIISGSLIPYTGDDFGNKVAQTTFAEEKAPQERKFYTHKSHPERPFKNGEKFHVLEKRKNNWRAIYTDGQIEDFPSPRDDSGEIQGIWVEYTGPRFWEKSEIPKRKFYTWKNHPTKGWEDTLGEYFAEKTDKGWQVVYHNGTINEKKDCDSMFNRHVMDGTWVEFEGVWPPEKQKVELQFPALPAGEEWHNPANLTAEQVGKDFRLITKREREERLFCKEKVLDCWNCDSWLNVGTMIHSKIDTYRVPISTPFGGLEKKIPEENLKNSVAKTEERVTVSIPAEIPPQTAEIPAIKQEKQQKEKETNKMNENTIAALPARKSKWIFPGWGKIKIAATSPTSIGFKTKSGNLEAMFVSDWNDCDKKIQIGGSRPKVAKDSNGITVNVGGPSFLKRVRNFACVLTLGSILSPWINMGLKTASVCVLNLVAKTIQK